MDESNELHAYLSGNLTMIRQALYNTPGRQIRVITPGTQKYHIMFDYNYCIFQTGACNLSHIEGWCQIIGPKNAVLGNLKANPCD